MEKSSKEVESWEEDVTRDFKKSEEDLDYQKKANVKGGRKLRKAKTHRLS